MSRRVRIKKFASRSCGRCIQAVRGRLVTSVASSVIPCCPLSLRRFSIESSLRPFVPCVFCPTCTHRHVHTGVTCDTQVNSQVIRPEEKAMLSRLVNIMVALELRFVQEKTEDGQPMYRLDP